MGQHSGTDRNIGAPGVIRNISDKAEIAMDLRYNTGLFSAVSGHHAGGKSANRSRHTRDTCVRVYVQAGVMRCVWSVQR